MSLKERSLFEAYDEIRQRDGQPPVVQSVCYARAVRDAKPRQLVHILATAGIKRDGHEVVPSGGIFEDYNKNPIVLWRHSTEEPEDVIGNGEVWLSSADGMERHVRGRTTYMREGKNPRADLVHSMYDDGVLSGISIRWEENGEGSVEEITPDEIRAAKIAGVGRMALNYGGLRFNQWRLEEYSHVPLGMDKDALTLRLRQAPNLMDAFVWKAEVKTKEGRTLFSLEKHIPEVDRPTYVDMSKNRQNGYFDDPEDQDGDNGDEPTPPEPTPSPGPVAEPEPEPTPAAAPPPAPSPPAPRPTAQPHAGIKADCCGLRDADGICEHSRASVAFSVHGNVPKADRGMAWDGSAARRRITAWASSDGSGEKSKIDTRKYRRAFLHSDLDRPEHLGAYKGLHHDVVDGRFVVVRSAVLADSQRLMQGAFDVSDAELSVMRSHLAQECARFDENPPWNTQAGRQYEQLHVMLRETTGGAADALRTAITSVADDIWGDDRIREAWEPRELPPGDREAWESVRTVLIRSLGEFMEDPEERDTKADSVLFSLDESLGGMVREHMAHLEFRRDLSRAIGIPESDTDFDKQVIERVSDLTGELPPEPAKAAPEDRISSLEQREARLRKAQERLTKKGTSILDRVAGAGS